MNNKTNNPPLASDLIDLSTAEILDDNTMSGLIGLQNSMLKHSQASLSSDQDYIPFAKDICGRYIVLYTFIARDENDVSVERGEFVTGELILNIFFISFGKFVRNFEKKNRFFWDIWNYFSVNLSIFPIYCLFLKHIIV